MPMRRRSSMLSQLLLVAAVGGAAAACEDEVCSPETASLVQAAKVIPELLHRETRAGTEPADPIIRPSAGWEPEHVKIGVICKHLYGIDMAAATATMDIVTTMTWTDKRVVRRIPTGNTTLTISEGRARVVMWLPDVTISNRDTKQIDKISSAVKFDTKGLVQKVDRMIVTVRNVFDDRAFPWDSQELVVMAASATLMEEDLVFEVDKEYSGLNPSIFAGKDFKYHNSTMTVYTDNDGALKKSRARFGINVHRDYRAYVPALVMPEVVVAAVGNSVFFLPLLPPFAMPRVASAIISVLAVLSHRNASVKLTGHGLSWLTVFEEVILVLVVACSLLNIFVESVQHTVGKPEIAAKMNSELKRLMPTLTILSILVCFSITAPENVEALSSIVRIVQIVVFGAYIAFCVRRLQKS